MPLKRTTLASNPGRTAIRLGTVLRCFPLWPSLGAAAFLAFAALALLLHPAFWAGSAVLALWGWNSVNVIVAPLLGLAVLALGGYAFASAREQRAARRAAAAAAVGSSSG